MTIVYRPRGNGGPGEISSLDRDPAAAGGTGGALEQHIHRFMKEVTDPAMLVGMAFGASAFNATRSLILPQLMRSSSPLMAKVPYLTRTVASSIALVPEVGAFWGSSKLIQGMMYPGANHWDLKSNAQELAHLTMTLGFLKSFGFAFGGIGALARREGIGFLPRHPMFWQQSGMLGGIMAGQGAEILLGWRAPGDFSDFLTDSLITLGQFNLGGTLSQQLLPGIYRFNGQLQHRMALQEREQLENISTQLSPESIFGTERFAFAGKGLSSNAMFEPGRPQINQSNGGGGTSPKEPKPSGKIITLPDNFHKGVPPGESLKLIREEVQNEFPRMRKLLDEMSNGEPTAERRLRDWDIRALLREAQVLPDNVAKLLLVLSEFGNRQAAQALLNHVPTSQAALEAIRLLAREGLPRGRETLAGSSLSSVTFALGEGNLRAATALEIIAFMGREEALEALGQGASQNNIEALMGLLIFVQKNSSHEGARQIARQIEVEGLLKNVDKGERVAIHALCALMEVGNPKAAQALVDRAAANFRFYTYWKARSKDNRFAREALQKVEVTQLYPRVEQGDFIAMRMAEELAELGNGRALAVLMQLAKESHGPALVILRELSEKNSEFRPDFLEAIRDYAWEVRSYEGEEILPHGAAMVFFDTLGRNGKLPGVFRNFREYQIRELGGRGEILLINSAGRSVVFEAVAARKGDHPFRIGDRVVLLPRLGGASPGPKDPKGKGRPDVAEEAAARKRLENSGLDVELAISKRSRPGKLAPAYSQDLGKVYNSLERYRVKSIRLGEGKVRFLVLDRILADGKVGTLTSEVRIEPQAGKPLYFFVANDLVDFLPLRAEKPIAGPGVPALPQALIPKTRPQKLVTMDAQKGVGRDLITLMGDRPSLARTGLEHGITMERAGQLEKYFEEGSIILDIPKRGPCLVNLESGATTIGDLLRVTPEEVRFYEHWKRERGFSPVDPKVAEQAWNRIQETAHRLGLQIRFGKNHYQDPMATAGGFQKVFREFGGQLVFLGDLLGLLPDSLLKNQKLEGIRLNTDRVGAGKLSSYEDSRVFLYEGTFLGSRRQLAAMLLHEVGHATAARYRVPLAKHKIPTSIPPRNDYMGDLNIPKEAREKMRLSHRTIAEQDGLIGLDFAGGPLYRIGYQTNSFSEFIGDLHVLYVAAGPRLRSHIQSFTPGSEIREAWDFVYGEMKDRIFSGREYDYQGVQGMKTPSLRPEDILVEVETPSLRPEDILVEVENTVELAGELKETWPVMYRGEKGNMRVGGLVKAIFFPPQELGADIYRDRKYTVEAAGADDSLILGNAKGDTLIARGLKETPLAQNISVGEDVILIPSLH